MTRQESRPEDEMTRAAAQLGQAASEFQRAAGAQAAAARAELASSRAALEELARQLQQELAAEREQRLLLGNQLTSLTASLERLVSHLQGLSQLMADLLERLATPPAPEPSEPAFPAGGEGVSLTLAAVPGFQALMDMQKALLAMDQVASASVERFQEGESRLLLQLRSPLTASELAAALGRATGHHLAVEDSRPELLRLRLKVVS